MDAVTARFAPGVSGLLAPLQPFLDDEKVTEILVNRPQEVFVEREGQMVRFDLPRLNRGYLRRLVLLIANENNQVLSTTTPLLSGNLADGSRIQIIIPPAARDVTLSIRKFILKPLGFADFAAQGFFNQAVGVTLLHSKTKSGCSNELLQVLYQTQDWQAFLHQAILARKNILISGATASGKTTFLNGCITQIPSDERLVILEDTYEIKTTHPNTVRLRALKPIGSRTHNVTMQDLVQATLRLRPDRIIMGEIRGREIFDFVSACYTGHSGSLATIHANNPTMAFMRMVQLYKLNDVGGMQDKDIDRMLHAVIDIVVQLKKTNHGRQLAEVYYKDAR